MHTKEKILHEIKIYRSELEELGVNRIGLFGSYSREEQSKKSDIDILVDFKEEFFEDETLKRAFLRRKISGRNIH